MKFEDAVQKLIAEPDVVLRRFAGSKAMLERFLKKFPQDKSFEQLTEAVKSDAYHDIEVAAHTLKGVTGNFGFDGLFHNSEAMVLAVRQGEYDKLPGLYDDIKRDYDLVIETINSIDA